MAIDTAAKRFSMMSFGNVLRMVPPDGSFDQGDRQTFAGFYGGILAAALALSVIGSRHTATVLNAYKSVTVDDGYIQITVLDDQITVQV